MYFKKQQKELLTIAPEIILPEGNKHTRKIGKDCCRVTRRKKESSSSICFSKADNFVWNKKGYTSVLLGVDRLRGDLLLIFVKDGSGALINGKDKAGNVTTGSVCCLNYTRKLAETFGIKEGEALDLRMEIVPTLPDDDRLYYRLSRA